MGFEIYDSALNRISAKHELNVYTFDKEDNPVRILHVEKEYSTTEKRWNIWLDEPDATGKAVVHLVVAGFPETHHQTQVDPATLENALEKFLVIAGLKPVDPLLKDCDLIFERLALKYRVEFKKGTRDDVQRRRLIIPSKTSGYEKRQVWMEPPQPNGKLTLHVALWGDRNRIGSLSDVEAMIKLEEGKTFSATLEDLEAVLERCIERAQTAAVV